MPKSWSLPADVAGLATTDQVLPFQCSMTVLLPVPSPAAQSWLVPGTAATDMKDVLTPPLFGAETSVHVLPFQCSVSGVAPGTCPTAHTSLAARAVTPFK
jgi:hypothetical protein